MARPNLREQNPYLPERFYKIPNFLDTRNPEMKVIAALLGHKPTPVQKLERKEDTSSTVTKDNQSFQDYLERLQPSERRVITNHIFGPKRIIQYVETPMASGFAFVSEYKVLDSQYSDKETEWVISTVINKLKKWNINIIPGKTTWNNVQDQIEDKWNKDIEKKEKRALTSITGPLILPG